MAESFPSPSPSKLNQPPLSPTPIPPNTTTNTNMKPITPPIITTLLTISPTSQTPTKTTNNNIPSPPKLAPQEACTLSTWSGAQCDGTQFAEYWYVPDEYCRSCRNNNGESHSFSLAGHCPEGTALIWPENLCDTDDNNLSDAIGIDFGGPGCYPVNPNTPWNSTQPCFK